jgi:hypothetical protein
MFVEEPSTAQSTRTCPTFFIFLLQFYLIVSGMSQRQILRLLLSLSDVFGVLRRIRADEISRIGAGT